MNGHYATNPQKRIGMDIRQPGSFALVRQADG
jgi:hypothetical protein